MKARQGFSLMEIVAVIIIVGILAVILAPRFTDTGTKAAWYQEEVRAGLRYAQRQAVAQRRSVFVDVQSSQIRLCYAAGCGAGTVLKRMTDGTDYALAAPTGVTLSPTGTISFDSLGQSAGATLSVSGSSGSIVVEAGSGHVH